MRREELLRLLVLEISQSVYATSLKDCSLFRGKSKVVANESFEEPKVGCEDLVTIAGDCLYLLILKLAFCINYIPMYLMKMPITKRN